MATLPWTWPTSSPTSTCACGRVYAPPARGERLGAALLEGYAPGTDVVDRLGPYVALTRLRLAGVYSFRPSPPGLVDDLLASATPDRSTLTGGGY